MDEVSEVPAAAGQVGDGDVVDVAAALREQARACAALGSRVYADLLDRLAEDWTAGGPTERVLVGHPVLALDPTSSALALRLLGGVHALVLQRRAGALGLWWPSVGGTWESGAGTAAVLELLDQHPAEVRAWLDHPPQTNEVGRAAALLGGLLHLPEELRLPVRLVELGASAGLNLLADRFAVFDERGEVVHGDPASSVRLEGAWRSPSGRPLHPWPDLTFSEAVGCDSQPVDPTSASGRLALSAYVWPDQPARWERLRAALDLAARFPPRVHRTSAAGLLADLEPRAGAVTVVWHSVVRQYLDPGEQEQVDAHLERLGASATTDAPVAHLSLEPDPAASDVGPGPGGMRVTLRTWPGQGEERVLGHAVAHGLPTTWA